MNVESQIADLVRAFAEELTQVIWGTALQRAQELLGPEGEAPRARPARSARPAPKPVPRAPAKPVAARVIPVPRIEEPAPVVDPWMKPLRPGVLETIEVRRPKRRAPKRRAEARAPIVREAPVRALVVDGVTIIPSQDTENAPVVAAPAPEAPAPAAAEPARKWVVVRRPARERSEADPAELGDELFDL